MAGFPPRHWQAYGGHRYSFQFTTGTHTHAYRQFGCNICAVAIMFATVSRGVGESDREKKNISTNNNPFIQIRYFHDLRSGGQFEVFNFIRILFSPWVYMCVCVCLRFWFYIFLICKMSERKKKQKELAFNFKWL